jgi:hypothetical protein
MPPVFEYVASLGPSLIVGFLPKTGSSKASNAPSAQNNAFALAWKPSMSSLRKSEASVGLSVADPVVADTGVVCTGRATLLLGKAVVATAVATAAGAT